MNSFSSDQSYFQRESRCWYQESSTENSFSCSLNTYVRFPINVSRGTRTKGEGLRRKYFLQEMFPTHSFKWFGLYFVGCKFDQFLIVKKATPCVSVDCWWDPGVAGRGLWHLAAPVNPSPFSTFPISSLPVIDPSFFVAARHQRRVASEVTSERWWRRRHWSRGDTNIKHTTSIFSVTRLMLLRTRIWNQSWNHVLENIFIVDFEGVWAQVMIIF